MSMVGIRQELTLKVAAYQRKLHPVCQVCGSGSMLFLHHILRRSLYANREAAYHMPSIFHALICANCNQNNGPYPVDNPEGRAKMLAQNIAVFGGLDKFQKAVSQWNEYTPNGHNPEIVDFAEVIEIYNATYTKN